MNTMEVLHWLSYMLLTTKPGRGAQIQVSDNSVLRTILQTPGGVRTSLVGFMERRTALEGSDRI